MITTSVKRKICKIAFLALLTAGSAPQPSQAIPAMTDRVDNSKKVAQLTKPTSSAPDHSFAIPPQVQEEQTLSLKQKRLFEVQGEIRFEQKVDTGHALFVTAENLGKIERSATKGRDGELSRMLIDFLEQNEALTGKAKDYDIRVLDIQDTVYSGDHITFRQFVGGVPVDRISHITTSGDGKVNQLALYMANPDNAAFHRTSWLGENVLNDLARSAWKKAFSVPLPDEAIDCNYLIVYLETKAKFAPAYEVRLGSRVVLINAIDGEVIRIGNFKVSGRQW